MTSTTVPIRPATVDNHPLTDDPCVCWTSGREGLSRWVGMPHPGEYAEGVRAAAEYARDI